MCALLFTFPVYAARDQGQIFGTGDVVRITTDTLSQSITAGMTGQLTGVQIQWNADVPPPAPLLDLSIVAGGNPPTGDTLYFEQLDLGSRVDGDLFTWDIANANLFFEEGDQFTFTLRADAPGFVIAANDPPGYDGGDLFVNGVAVPESAANDIAFITFVGEPDLQSPLGNVQVSSVRDIGVVENDPGVLMRDVGYSALFQGRSVWFFGDTILEAPNVYNQRLLSNSWSATYDSDAADGLVGFQPRIDEIGASTLLVPLTEEEREFNLSHQGKNCQEEPCGARWAIWPGTIVVAEVKEVAYLFYHKFYSEPGEFNFYHVGHSIAVWKNFDAPVERPEFGFYGEYPTLFFSEERDGFGSAAVMVDQKLYVYGCELLAEDLTKPCRLARVPMGDILDRNAWQFYRGQNTWSSNINNAVNVFYGNDMMTVFYNQFIARYVAIYSLPLDARVMMRTALRPEGPWSESLELFKGKRSKSSTGWIYDALAHPEFSEEEGKTIYITYSRQTGPRTSEIRLVAVDLELVE
jgi:hypothetical protein